LSGADTVRVDIPGTATVGVDREVATAGSDFLVRATLPVKPLTGVTDMTEVQELPPATTVKKKGSGVMSKSGPLTLTNTLVLFVMIPSVPDTSTK
jgi:hypothetical protein